MSLLPSPIPHPLDHCPWDLPGWVYEALDWVVGVEWPDGNECAVWDLADRWYAVADVLTGPRNDATGAASEVRSGYGGVGAVAAAFDTAWRRVAEGDEAPLPVLFAVTGELGRLVESCGCDIEGAKLEVWIELGILVVELLSLAVATVLTAGAASPAAGVAITTTRMVVQQIFKRLMAQLARKAIREGLKEAGERAAKQVVKSGVRGLARRAALGGLAEAGEEAGVSLATQAYQNSTGRGHGLDLTDVATSAVGGFAGGAVAPLSGLGRHADGRLGRIGEHFGREMTGETLAEGAAGLVTGQGVSLEDLARAAVSGASGSATGQADAALHHRLDGRLAALAGAAPPSLDLTALASPVVAQPSELAAGVVDPLPVQRTADQVIGSLTGTGVADHVVADVGSARPDPTDGVLAGPQAQGDGVVGGQPTADPSPFDLAAVHQAFAEPEAGHQGLAGQQALTGAETGPPAVDSAAGPGLGASADTGAPSVGVGAPTSPTLSSVAVESPTVSVPGIPSIGPGAATGPTLDPTTPSVAAQAGASPAVLGGTTFPTPQPATSADRLAAPATTAASPAPTAPAPEHSGTGPDDRPRPSPRFPLLEALAPGPAHRTDEPLPDPPRPFHRPPPRPRTPDREAALAADREGLDRRRYQGYFEAQRQWFEDKRRYREADWLRVRADRNERLVAELSTQAEELRRTGRDLAAERFQRQAFEASQESYDLRDRVRTVLDGLIVPNQVMVEDAADFHRINDDVADLAVGAVETSDRSALTGDDDPPPIDRSRRYGIPGGLRPPLALHQTDLERQMPRAADGGVLRTPDPRRGGWFRLANDGGPQADPTRGINCLDCTLSLYETWMHGRPRVSAPRTFDGYSDGDISRPLGGEQDGPQRVEATTGGRFQALAGPAGATTYAELRQNVERGYHDLHRQLLTGGHGSYAFLISSWEGGGSHAWVALNQNGSVLYLDPQNGTVHDRPLYGNTGWPGRANVIAVEALVMGRDGTPMPLPGRPRGAFSVLPDPPPTRPDQGDAPDFNRVHLLGEAGPGGAAPAGGTAPSTEPDPARLRQARLGAHSDRVSAMLTVRDVLAGSTDLDQVFAAGVTPAELVHHLDPATLRGLAPQLDDAAARDVARLLGDPRVQQMLDQTWEAPPRDEPLLAEALVRQLAQRPDLARMILATPELASSLTARPLTLHHLASHQQAIDVLGEVLADIADRGPEAVAVEEDPKPQPTPLTPRQRQISAAVAARRQPNLQLGFDTARRDDENYRQAYVERLIADAVVAQQELNGIAMEVAGDHGEPGWRLRPKGRARVLDKLVEYRNEASRLKDLAAAKVQFRQLDDIYRAVDQLAADPRVLILDIKDRFLTPSPSGYRDVLVNLRMTNGHVAELRLHLAGLDRVAEWEHALYEVRRDLEAISETDGRPLTVRERAIRDGLLRRVQDSFWRALGEGL